MMVKLLLILSLLSPFVSIGENVYIPDPIFKNYLINNKDINLNQDNEIQYNEALYTKEISVWGLGIKDLTGIESFVNLTDLDCSHTKLTDLNLSKNTKLIRLYAYNIYGLKKIDVTNCIQITDFWCDNDDLTFIDVTKNSKLDFFQCNSNKLTSLDLSQNSKLTILRCQGNELSYLDLRNGNLQNMSKKIFNIYNINLNCILVDNPIWASKNIKLPYHMYFSSTCESIDKIISKNEAIRQAEKFLKEQGYTKYEKIDSSKLVLEDYEYKMEIKVILENRFNKFTLTPLKVELTKRVLWEITFQSINKKEEITVLINSHKNLMLIKPRLN